MVPAFCIQRLSSWFSTKSDQAVAVGNVQHFKKAFGRSRFPTNTRQTEDTVAVSQLIDSVFGSAVQASGSRTIGRPLPVAGLRCS